MSSECKIVKGMSLFMLVLGLLGLAAGIFMFVNAPAAAEVTTVESPVVTAEALGAILAVTGAVYLVAGVMGAKGANNPVRLGGFVAVAWVLALVNAAEAVLSYMSGGSVWQNVLLAAVAAAAASYASRAKAAAAR